MEACDLREGLRRYLSDREIQLLQKTPVGIAGVGGLGSNVAMLLARSGMECMTLIDQDIVDKSNLNRQHFWPRHLRQSKIDAIRESLLDLNPHMKLALHKLHLDATNIDSMLPACSIWVEALDDAESKALFVEKALLAQCRVVSASGICGIGGKDMVKRKIGRLTLVGDFQTDLCMAPPMAPRVTQAAAIMADCILALILNPERERS